MGDHQNRSSLRHVLGGPDLDVKRRAVIRIQPHCPDFSSNSRDFIAATPYYKISDTRLSISRAEGRAVGS